MKTNLGNDSAMRFRLDKELHKANRRVAASSVLESTLRFSLATSVSFQHKCNFFKVIFLGTETRLFPVALVLWVSLASSCTR